MAGTMFGRIDDDWVGHLLGPDTVVHMPEIGVDVSMAEVYASLDVAAADEPTSTPSAEPTSPG